MLHRRTGRCAFLAWPPVDGIICPDSLLTYLETNILKKLLLTAVMLTASYSALAQQAAPAMNLPADAAVSTKEQEVETTRKEMASDDTDKNGKISLTEFLNRNNDQQTQLFKAMDLNNDGEMTPEEFVSYREQRIEASKKQMQGMQGGAPGGR